MSTLPGTRTSVHLTRLLLRPRRSVQFDSAQAIKIKAIRGQVTAVKATSNLNCVVCGDGYIAPAQDQLMHTGATFNPKSSSLAILPADQAVNLANAARLSPAFTQLQPVSDRAGLRCVTPDYLPIVGPLPQPEFLNQFATYNTNRWAYVDTPAAFLSAIMDSHRFRLAGFNLQPTCRPDP